MREIHVEVDEATMAAYGWEDLPLDHGFHTYRQMERWTVSPAARVEILDRLLGAEPRAGAGRRPGRAGSRRSCSDDRQPSTVVRAELVTDRAGAARPAQWRRGGDQGDAAGRYAVGGLAPVTVDPALDRLDRAVTDATR